MAILERALSKLSIEAFTDADMKTSVGKKFQVMYNPGKLRQTYAAIYKPEEPKNDVAQKMRFERMGDGYLSLPLIFDGQLNGNRTSVTEQLSTLYNLCGVKDSKSGETRYLKVIWGAQSWDGSGSFIGRFSRLSVSQEVFDNDGSPLKASVTLELVLDNPKTVKNQQKTTRSTGTQTSTGTLRRNILIQRRAGVKPGWLGHKTLGAFRYESERPGYNYQSLVRAPYRDPLPLIAARSPGRLEVDYLDLALLNSLVHLGAFEAGDSLLWPEDEA